MDIKNVRVSRNKELGLGLVTVLAHEDGRLNGITDAEHLVKGLDRDNLVSAIEVCGNDCTRSKLKIPFWITDGIFLIGIIL